MNLRGCCRGFISLNSEIHSKGWESGIWEGEILNTGTTRFSIKSTLLLPVHIPLCPME